MYAFASRYYAPCSLTRQYSNSLHAAWFAMHVHISKSGVFEPADIETELFDHRLEASNSQLHVRVFSSPNTMRRCLCPSHSHHYHFFPLLLLLQRIHVRVFFLYLLPYSFSSIAITPLSKSYTRPSQSAFLMLPIQFVASTAASQTAEGALERKDKTLLLLALPSNQAIFHLHTQVECPTVHDRATRCVSFSSIIDPLHSGFRYWHHHTLLQSPVQGKIFDTICIDALALLSSTVAQRGLAIFHDLIEVELRGRQPRAKSLCIELTVMFTFQVSPASDI